MFSNKVKQLNHINYFNLGQYSFFIATFFLASALPISILFYLLSIIIFFKNKTISISNDFYNKLLLLSTGILLFSTINSVNNIKENISEFHLDIWISLFNWIPLFILFITSQIYLKTALQRMTFSKTLIAGTVPVLVSCALQGWFGVVGPFEIFNGLIVWYLDVIDFTDIAIAGLFSNRNYTAIWLSAVFAFSVFEFFNFNKHPYKNILIILINFMILYFAFYTLSRNALLTIFLTLMFVLRKFKLIFPLIFIYTFANLIFLNLFNRYEYFFSEVIGVNLKRFFILNIENFANFNRIDIFTNTASLIKESPLLGWGGSTFPLMYQLNGGQQSTQHSHNIILELAYNYGIPLAILLTFLVFKLLYDSYQKIFSQTSDFSNTSINKAWFASTIVVCVSHLTDITYYDGKISILIWILLSGIKCIIDDNIKNPDPQKSL